ncbi:MAG: chemotaxis protein CheA [Chryseotalea sp.]
MDALQHIFKQECTELLEKFEQGLVQASNGNIHNELIAELFRSLHTIKGSAAMFGFQKINELTHELEFIFDAIRNQQLNLSKNLIDLPFDYIDITRTIILSGDENKTEQIYLADTLLAKIKSLPISSTQNFTPAKSSAIYYIHLVPQESLFLSGNNLLYVLEDLLTVGNTVCKAFLLTPADIDSFAFNRPLVGFEILLQTHASLEKVHEQFIFIQDHCQIQVEEIPSYTGNISSIDTKHFSDYSASTSLRNAIYTIATHNIENTVANQKNHTTEKHHHSIRVASYKLDDLMSLVSELITTQAQLEVTAEKTNNNQLNNVVEALQKISRRMRDTVFSVCLIPLDSVLVRFQRMVADLSKELYKEIKFEAVGTDIELDKYVIENLVDPLLHLIRNCADHGIEEKEIRLQKGKNAAGKVQLKAYTSGTHAILEISDDGAGIDQHKILHKAIQLGLANENETYQEEEIIHFIFHPGFSTAQTVTAVSGRGVGMDVVKKNIEKLKGTIKINTTLHKGSVFTIKLPLTLSITEGLLVKIGNSLYVIPLEHVVKCITISTENIQTTWSYTEYTNTQLPILALQKVFYAKQTGAYPKAVLVEYQNQLVGLAVDEVVGEHQIVLKSLGEFYKNSPEYGGATILGNGQVSLVIDVAHIIENNINPETKFMYGNTK